MPVIKSAKKKLRQDRKVTLERAKFEETVKEAVRKAVSAKSEKTVKEAVSMLDKAAKKHIFHMNKVARIKSRLAHLLSPKGTVTNASPAKKVEKKAKAKKTPVKKASGKK